MYKRMLDKQNEPSFEDMLRYCGDTGQIWLQLDEWIKNEYSAETLIRFPYGKDYGWGVKYSKGKKHICDVFAEENAFTVFLKINDKPLMQVYDELSKRSQEIYADKYPCGDGGFINYPITSVEHLEDAKRFINVKMAKKQK